MAAAVHRRRPLLDGDEEQPLPAVQQGHRHSKSGPQRRRNHRGGWTGHLIANIEVAPGHTASELEVFSSFIVYRNRSETEQDFYVGTRRDALRRIDGTLRISSRKITLDQNVLVAKNISIFF
jgi:3-phenylpropionate/cinnamic acid dioxygenase small subunit